MSAAVDTMIGSLFSQDLFMTKGIIIVFIKSSGRCVKNYMSAAVDTMIGSITAKLLVDVHFVFITGLLLATTSSVDCVLTGDVHERISSDLAYRLSCASTNMRS